MKTVKNFYENHSTFHEGDSGLDLFVTENIVIPAKALGFKIDMGSVVKHLEIKANKEIFHGIYIQDRQWVLKRPLDYLIVGIMDAGYRGNVIGIFDNLSDEDYLVEQNTRLLQICSPILDEISFQLTDSSFRNIKR